MKKVIITIALLSTALGTNAQNVFPASGNVGIGTSAPLGPLHISSSTNRTLRLDKTNVPYGSYTWQSLETNSVEQWRIVGRESDNAGLEFWSKNSDRVLSLLQNGNIGIGSPNPSEKLDLSKWMTYNLVNDSGIKLGNLNETSVNNNKSHSYTLKTFGDANGIRLGIVQQSRIKNDVEVLSILNDNVGIGSPNPSEKLDLSKWMTYNLVNDSGIKLGNLNETSVNNNKSYSYTLKTFGDANGIRLGIVQQGRIKNDVEVLSILNDNVGIGTKAPDMKLTVKGSIHAEEVKIDLNVPVPDYVFKEDYQLRSIEEVEKFVQEHNHLPEIPSAAEFKQNGVMLAEMNMNLLKKIEELTLYTIHQEKKIKRLENENQELKSLANRLVEIEKLLLEMKK